MHPPGAGSTSEHAHWRRPVAAVGRAAARALAALALAGCGALSGPGHRGDAAPGAEGVIRFTTTESLPLTATLQLPLGADPVPAVVLMHDCQGPARGAIRGWQTALVTWGYATLAVDGFAPRAVTNVCEGADKLWPAERVPDAYAALRALARHPRIAAGRIALMGWGDGATAALQSASAAAAQRYGDASGPRFRAVIALYPTCRLLAPDAGPATDGDRLTAPVRIHAGELDDWAPASACQARVAQWRHAGQDAELTIFPGAHHLFDSIGRADEELPGVDNHGGERHRKGARVAWSPDATRAVRAKVREQLERLLGAERGGVR